MGVISRFTPAFRAVFAPVQGLVFCLALLTGPLASAQVVTNELRPETVLQLLVDQVSGLLEVDAADCYLYAPDGRMLRCAKRVFREN